MGATEESAKRSEAGMNIAALIASLRKQNHDLKCQVKELSDANHDLRNMPAIVSTGAGKAAKIKWF